MKFGLPKFKIIKTLPFCCVNLVLNRLILKLGREDLSDPNKYKNVDLFITCGFPYKVPVQHIDNGKTIAINYTVTSSQYWGPDP